MCERERKREGVCEKGQGCVSVCEGVCDLSRYNEN